MDIVQLHERALDEMARLVGGVRPEQLGLPTPCTEWDVRALLAHLVGGNLRWAARARGEQLPPGPAQGVGPHLDLLGDDPAEAYRRSATELAELWRDPALLDRSFELPIGVLSGRDTVAFHLAETLTHGWDLSRATGQHPAFDPEAVRAALRFAQSHRLAGTFFAAPVPVADDLPEIDRLAALLGRTP